MLGMMLLLLFKNYDYALAASALSGFLLKRACVEGQQQTDRRTGGQEAKANKCDTTISETCRYCEEKKTKTVRLVMLLMLLIHGFNGSITDTLG